MARCDAAIPITRYVAADIARELAPVPVPVRVIHNGATDLSCAPREAIAGIADGPPYLLHISRLAPSKNVVALLALAGIGYAAVQQQGAQAAPEKAPEPELPRENAVLVFGATGRMGRTVVNSVGAGR